MKKNLEYLIVAIASFTVISGITVFKLKMVSADDVKIPIETVIEEGRYIDALSYIAGTIDIMHPDYEAIDKIIKKGSTMPLEDIVSIMKQARVELPEHRGMLTLGLGYIYLLKNKPDDALSEFNNIADADLKPFLAELKYECKGNAYLSKGDISIARDNFEEAKSIDPSRPMPYLKLGEIYHKNLNDLERAKEYYSQYLKLNPNAPEKEEIEKILR